MKIKPHIAAILAIAISIPAIAEDGKNQFNPIQTGVTSLNIAPDAPWAT